MKRAAVAAFLFFVCASAFADEWQTTDGVLLGSSLGLLALDWAQTRKVTYATAAYVTPVCADPATRRFAEPCELRTQRLHSESNALLGHQPSNAEINRYFVATMAGTALLSFALPKGPRRLFLGSVLAVESVVAFRNHRLGLRIAF